MAILGGHQGAVTVTGTFSTIHIHIHSWNAEFDENLFESTEFGASLKGMSWYRGIYVMRGTLTGFYPNAVAFPIADIEAGAAASSLVLTSTTGETFTFSAHLVRPSIGVTVQGGAPINSLQTGFVSHGTIATASA